MEQIDLKQSIYAMGHDRTLDKEQSKYEYSLDVYRLLSKASKANLNYFEGVISFEVFGKTYLIGFNPSKEDRVPYLEAGGVSKGDLIGVF